MDPISNQIHDFLKDLRTPPSQSFQLTFSYNGIDYRTVFHASHTFEEGQEVIEVDNGCVNVTFGFTLGPTEDPPTEKVFHKNFVGGIQAENGVLGWIDLEGKKACFQPKLTTDPRTKAGKRTTAGDVLQTLKTKIARAFPVGGAPVRLIDGIRKESGSSSGSPTMTSPFHLVRGGNAYYERFGYRSEKINRLKESIRPVTWEECTQPMKDIIQDCTKKEYAVNQLLTDIMKDISWEDEVAYNETHRPSLSSTVFREFARTKGISKEESSQWMFYNIWTFELDADSSDWKGCDADLVFTSFTPISSGTVSGTVSGGAGGRRKTRKRMMKKRATRSASQRKY